MNVDIFNQITEYSGGYKRVSFYLLEAYDAIKPPIMGSVASILFRRILFTKKYKEEKKIRDAWDREEQKRIYNWHYISVEDILMAYDPQKYVGEKNVANLKKNVNNFRRNYLTFLHENNIIYCLCLPGRPSIYIFFIERYLPSWKCWNEKGCVSPKMIRKVLDSSSYVYEALLKFAVQRGRTLDLEGSKKVFGAFVGELVSKMNPDVCVQLPAWNDQCVFEEYAEILKDKLSDMEDFEGVEIPLSFNGFLPPSIREKYMDIHNETSDDKIKTIEDLDEELSAKEPDMGKKKPRKKKSTKAVSKSTKTTTTPEATRPSLLLFKSADPFKNATELVLFYSAMIRSKYKKAKIPEIKYETNAAARILDLMNDRGYKDNRQFIKGWITWYAQVKLTQNKSNHEKYTTILEFEKTFDEFSGKFVC